LQHRSCRAADPMGLRAVKLRNEGRLVRGRRRRTHSRGATPQQRGSRVRSAPSKAQRAGRPTQKRNQDWRLGLLHGATKDLHWMRQGVQSCVIGRFFSSALPFFAWPRHRRQRKRLLAARRNARTEPIRAPPRGLARARGIEGSRRGTEPLQRQCRPSLPRSRQRALRR
jgi:hypothetical protein